MSFTTEMRAAIRQLPPFLKKLNPEIYNSDNYIVLDFETTNEGKGTASNSSNNIILTVWKRGRAHPNYREGACNRSVRWSSEYELLDLVKDIEAADFIVAHNAKFELSWLKRCGLDINQTLPFCTMIAEYCIAGNRKWELGLDSSLKRRGMGGKMNVVSALIHAGICPSKIPSRWLEHYCITDVEQTEALFLKQRELANHIKLLPVMFTRNIFTVPLIAIEENGIHLDADRVKAVYKNHSDRLAILSLQFDDISGGANPKSGPQMRKLIFEDLGFNPPLDHKKKPFLTPGGELSTSAKVLAKLEPKNNRQREFLKVKNEIGKVRDALSKALRHCLDCVTYTDEHVLYADFNQTVTGTHRLSSTGKLYKMQLQNIPNEFKPLFSPRHDGWLMGEIDEAQLEYRVAVHLGDDEAGKYDIAHKVDAHAFTASIIFEEEWTEVCDDKENPRRKKVRSNSKEHTFKPLYGGQSGTPREKKYYKAFQDKHKGVTAAQDSWKAQVLSKKYLRSASGLLFYWPDTKVTRSGYITNSTNICNYPVQSFATADIVPVAVTYQYHLMRIMKMQSFLVDTVHDSSIGEVHPNEKELYETIGVYSMTDCVTRYCSKVWGIELRVPLEAEAAFKSHWSDDKSWREKYGIV